MKRPLISHVGIAVADLKTAVAKYTKLLGEGPEVTRDVPEMGVQVAIFSGGIPDGGDLELLAATGDNSISRFVAKRGEGIHHVCIQVDDIEKKLAELIAGGFRLIDEVPRIGALGHKIAFVHPEGTHGVLIELEERAEED